MHPHPGVPEAVVMGQAVQVITTRWAMLIREAHICSSTRAVRVRGSMRVRRWYDTVHALAATLAREVYGVSYVAELYATVYNVICG